MSEIHDQLGSITGADCHVRSGLSAMRAGETAVHDLVHRSMYGYRRDCGCPDCRDHYNARWPCGRPRRSWETPVPMPLDYPPIWPQYTCGVAVGNTEPQQAMNHGAMSGVGATNLCN